MKKIAVLLCITAAAVLVTTGLVLNRPKQRIQTLPASSEKSTSSYFTSNTPSSQENSGTTPAQAGQNDIYIVKEYQGHIGVYRNNETKPFKEYDTDILILPKSDQDALKRGKTVHTLAEVEKIIEDYDG